MLYDAIRYPKLLHSTLNFLTPRLESRATRLELRISRAIFIRSPADARATNTEQQARYKPCKTKTHQGRGSGHFGRFTLQFQDVLNFPVAVHFRVSLSWICLCLSIAEFPCRDYMKLVASLQIVNPKP